MEEILGESRLRTRGGEDLHSLGSNLKVLSRRVRANSRRNKDGVPVGCTVTKTGRAAFSSLYCSVPRQAKERRSHSPRTGQPERPRGSRCGAAARSSLRPRSPPPACHCLGSPALGAELHPAGAYLGHWPALGGRRKPAAACTPLSPPRAPSRRRPRASASPFLPREVGARLAPQHQQQQQKQQQPPQRLRSLALLWTRTSAGS